MKHHRDHFRVAGGGGRTKHLHAELVEFPQAARLGFLIPERGQQIRRLYRKRIAQKPVFDGASQGTCGPFRPQGNGPAALVLKGVHFLLHHVGGIAHRAVKQLRMLKSGDADLPETIQPRDLHYFFLQILPFITLGRKYILGASGPFG